MKNIINEFKSVFTVYSLMMSLVSRFADLASKHLNNVSEGLDVLYRNWGTGKYPELEVKVVRSVNLFFELLISIREIWATSKEMMQSDPEFKEVVSKFTNIKDDVMEIMTGQELKSIHAIDEALSASAWQLELTTHSKGYIEFLKYGRKAITQIDLEAFVKSGLVAEDYVKDQLMDLSVKGYAIFEIESEGPDDTLVKEQFIMFR